MKQSIGSGRGSVYNIIMKALQSGDKYGYEICQEVEIKTNGNYILKQPSLYSGLKRLEAQKLVESYWGDSEIGGRRHYYRLTQTGRQKIEQTDFSWEDERNEIVDKFFEQSELDKSLNEVKSAVSEITQKVQTVDNTNEEINNIFNQQPIQTEKSAQKQPSFAHKVNENQFDLFSLSSNFEENQSKENDNNNVNDNEITDQQELLENIIPVIEEKNEASPILQKEAVVIEEKTKQNENTSENFIEDTQNFDEKIIEHEDIIKEQSVEKIEEETLKESVEEEVDFEEFFKYRKTNSFSKKTEEVSSTPISLVDLEKSSTFYGSNNSFNFESDIQPKDDFEEQYKQWTKTVNIIDSQKYNEEERNEEKICLEQEKRMSDILSGNINQNNNYDLHKTFDDNQEQESINNLDLASIFGNVLENNVQDNELEKNDSIDYTGFNTNTQKDYEEPISYSSPQTSDDLPRYNMLDNVNLSLQADKPINKPNENYYGPFNEQKIESKSSFEFNYENITNNKQSSFENNVSFDKKYKEKYFNLSDYQIRYLRKNNIEQKVTNYTSINKLNLLTSGLTALLAILISLSLFFISFDKMNNTVQLVSFITTCVSTSLWFTYYFVKFLQDKNKKIIFKFEKELFVNSLFLGILAMIIVFCLNMIFGLNFLNILSFSGSFIVPSLVILLIILFPIIKLFFAKIPFFNR